MHTFYLAEAGAAGERIPLEREEEKHALKVLRLSDGDEICALDGRGGRFQARLRIWGGRAFAELEAPLADNEPAVRISLYQGLPKADKLEWIAQKGTELGLSALCPVQMRSSVVKSNEKDGQKRQERLERIAREAVKQCRRSMPPQITPPLTWAQALKRLSSCELVLVPWENERAFTLKQAREAYPNAKDIAIVIGPEGGIAREEIEALTALHTKCITLGGRILRTETAALAAIAVVQTLWGDL
ncbi:MAG: 16S rRNA (uracil(1498)-N(3))-methyltransferase [Clostridia bacterium]|nr:16S rRNA (uracil(1498)-N(3))-methyltransferase [Clostridia bacterium]